MRIAVVGATGPTGRLIVEEAARRGHDVVVFARRPGAVTSSARVRVIGGALEDTAAFSSAIAGVDVLVSALGASSMRERAFMTTHMPKVTAALTAAGVPRLVMVGAFGSGPVPPAMTGMNRVVFRVLSRLVFGDRTRAEAALTRDGVPWAAAYPAFLTDDPALPEVQTAPVDRLVTSRNSRIPRANVARLMVDLAEDTASSGKRIAIAPLGTYVTQKP